MRKGLTAAWTNPGKSICCSWIIPCRKLIITRPTEHSFICRDADPTSLAAPLLGKRPSFGGREYPSMQFGRLLRLFFPPSNELIPAGHGLPSAPGHKNCFSGFRFRGNGSRAHQCFHFAPQTVLTISQFEETCLLWLSQSFLQVRLRKRALFCPLCFLSSRYVLDFWLSGGSGWTTLVCVFAGARVLPSLRRQKPLFQKSIARKLLTNKAITNLRN